jgi:translation elongation factor EF-Ts
VRLLVSVTDMPMMQCKAALVACSGDMDKAVNYLRNPPTIEQRLAALEQQVEMLQRDRHTHYIPQPEVF